MNNIKLTGKLKENITNLFGEKGKIWLDNLPNIIDRLTTYWCLSSLTPVSNMSYHYVAKANLDNQKVVLKIGFDHKTILEEERALNYFDGHASIKLIDRYLELHALLLQQAVPGTTLKSFYPMQIEFVMDSYIQTMQKLHFQSAPLRHDFRHINNWLKAIDNTASHVIPTELLNNAILLKNKLLSSPSQQFVLHGDLHHDNILKHDDDWLTIDPKGIVGEPEFEIAAFDFISNEELDYRKDIQELFNARAKLLAEKSGLDPQRIKDWIFVRLILSAVWSIEDNCDPSWAINLVKLISS